MFKCYLCHKKVCTDYFDMDSYVYKYDKYYFCGYACYNKYLNRRFKNVVSK